MSGCDEVSNLREENKKLKDIFVANNFKQAECRFFSVEKENKEKDEGKSKEKEEDKNKNENKNKNKDEDTNKDKEEDKDKDKCCCGETKANHKDDETKYVLSKWDLEKSIEKTNSTTYGKIEFESEISIKAKDLTDYVRLSHEDEVEKVFELLKTIWSVKIGNLAISVIGGAKNFHMAKKDKDVFTNGLIKATQTTNALIITTGLNVGIAKVVGQAVLEAQTFLFDKKKHNNPICCLGITPWGYVLNRKLLADSNGETVKYKVSNEIKSQQPVSLNSNHTHYLFVDEGLRNKFGGTKTGEFRAKFEKYMTDVIKMSVVLVIVEGGYDIFQEASRSVKQNIPIVICEGTGRAADVLGEAYRERTKNNTDKEFKFSDEFKKSSKLNEIYNGIETEKIWGFIETIMKSESLITTFNMKTSEDLDIAILYSLIKKMKHDKKEDVLKNQIELCLTWDRVDIARDKIFMDEIELSTENWNKLLKQSIIADKVEFIRLFLNNGASIRDFLKDHDSLKSLYVKSKELEKFDKTVPKGINDVNAILEYMIGQKTITVYQNCLTKPFNDLLIWSVLMERHECAKLFWEHCKDSTFMAIVATKLYLKRKNKSETYEIERIRELDQWKDYFEDMAIKVIDECHDIDPAYAEKLINFPMEKWGGITCLELAFKSKDRKFISSIACQNSIDLKWYNGTRMTLKKCFFGTFFPCYVLHIHKQKTLNKTNSSDKDTSFCTIIQQFYKAPQTKFVIHLILNLAFVIYNSIVILFFMRRNNLNNPHEIIFIFYHICFILDRFIEMKTFNKKPLKYCFRDWRKESRWKYLDIGIVILCFTGIVLGIARSGTSGQTLVNVYLAAKTFYSFTVGLFYLRFMRLLTFNNTLGPKMEMIIKMLYQLFPYLLIIVIILISYGVTSQASYYTERTFSMLRLLEVISYPYWSLFGELSLDETVYFPKCDMSIANDIDGGCPENNYAIPILYAFYIFIGNILLLNVLIAIFSHIFQEIHQESINIWKFSMYSLVREYEKKTIFPPPFSFIEYIIHGIIFFYFKIYKDNRALFSCNNKVGVAEEGVVSSENNSSTQSLETISKESKGNVNNYMKMKLLEIGCQKLVINNKRIEEQRSVENCVFKMSQELKTLGTSVSVIKENVTNMAINGNSAQNTQKCRETTEKQPSKTKIRFKELNQKLEEQASKTSLRFNELDQKLDNILSALESIKSD